MKKIIDCIKSNMRQIIEIVVLAIVIFIPRCVNLSDIFKDYLENNPLSPDNIPWYIAISYGSHIASLILFFAVLIAIRKCNSDFVMNRKFVYHDYCYAWYWLCSKILGVKKCDLVLVPIFMQFKLVIRSTFDDFPLNEDEYPVVDNEPESRVTEWNMDNAGNEINLILEDTYIIEKTQLPVSKRNLRTIKISRNAGNGRHFSQKFIETTMNVVRKLDETSIVNLYTTTNPMNTKHIAKRVFALGGRGNIAHLYVFQQGQDEKRTFQSKAYKVY